MLTRRLLIGGTAAGLLTPLAGAAQAFGAGVRLPGRPTPGGGTTTSPVPLRFARPTGRRVRTP